MSAWSDQVIEDATAMDLPSVRQRVAVFGGLTLLVLLIVVIVLF